MPGVKAIQRKLKALKNQMPAVLDLTVEQTKDKIIELNKNQLLHGLDASGNKIGEYKNLNYAIRKFSLNNLAGFGMKDYRLTGDYYAAIYAIISNGKLTIGSSDGKNKWLDFEGEFGLTPESKQEYKPVFRPVFFENSRNVLKNS
jgi:hypothetical protein